MTLKEILAQRKANASGQPECDTKNGRCVAVVTDEEGQQYEVDLTMPAYDEICPVVM